MAASGKAQALKDAYVEALAKEAGPEVMAEAGAASLGDLAGKLGMEQGQQAGIIVDLKSGNSLARNDGNPRFIISDGNNMQITKNAGAAFPLQGGYGAEHYGKLPPNEMRNFGGALYQGVNDMYSLGAGSGRSQQGLGRLYDSGSARLYTR
jgi:hypothetical protein